MRSLYGFATKLAGDASAAEDLVQETYLKAFQAFGHLRNPDRARPWLFQILSRLVIDWHRRAAREIATPPDELDRLSLYDLIRRGSFSLLRPPPRRLPGPVQGRGGSRGSPGSAGVHRVLLVLLYSEGLTYQELADVLGCPVGTVMSRLHRGRKRLERELWECAHRRGW